MIMYRCVLAYLNEQHPSDTVGLILVHTCNRDEKAWHEIYPISSSALQLEEIHKRVMFQVGACASAGEIHGIQETSQIVAQAEEVSLCPYDIKPRRDSYWCNTGCTPPAFQFQKPPLYSSRKVVSKQLFSLAQVALSGNLLPTYVTDSVFSYFNSYNQQHCGGNSVFQLLLLIVDQ